MGELEDFHHSPQVAEILKQMPLYTRIKVPLEMEYLNIIIEPDTCCTDEQMKEAAEWADKTATFLVKEVEEWIADGSPQEPIPDDKQSEEDHSPTPT